MRFAFYILAFYTLALSCIPCQDELFMPAGVQSAILVTSNSDRADTGTPDLCSPFCICACCSGITLQQHIPHTLVATSFSFDTEKDFPYFSHSVSGNSATIWQPPRI